eukprot:scaffold19425_cov129-Isochrysis_galbana.AAC.1
MGTAGRIHKKGTPQTSCLNGTTTAEKNGTAYTRHGPRALPGGTAACAVLSWARLLGARPRSSPVPEAQVLLLAVRCGAARSTLHRTQLQLLRS